MYKIIPACYLPRTRFLSCSFQPVFLRRSPRCSWPWPRLESSHREAVNLAPKAHCSPIVMPHHTQDGKMGASELVIAQKGTPLLRTMAVSADLCRSDGVQPERDERMRTDWTEWRVRGGGVRRSEQQTWGFLAICMRGQEAERNRRLQDYVGDELNVELFLLEQQDRIVHRHNIRKRQRR